MKNNMKKIIEYFENVISEMKKVHWPTRDMLISSTGVVIVMTLLFSAYIYIVDFGLNTLIKLALGR